MAEAPQTILACAAAVWVGVFAVHLGALQDRFGTHDYDLAIWDQAVWLLAHGHSLITVRGLNVFGFHASPGLYLLVPFYWLGAGPKFLNLVMVSMFALGVVPIFKVARHHLRNDWHALILALAFLVNYAGQWMLNETFHPELLAVTPLLFAYLAAVEGRWRSYAGWLVFALLWKEDVALAGLMLGAVLAVRGTRTVTGRVGPSGTRRAGWWTIVLCLGWFLVATRLLIPANSSGGLFTETLFGNLGGSPTEMVHTAVTHPGLVLDHLHQSDPRHYVADLTSSYGFVSLASPLILLVGLPQALINLLGVYNFFWKTGVHYAVIPLLAASLAAIEGVARWRRVEVRRFLLGLVAVGAFFTCVTWGISPASPLYRKGYWQLYPVSYQHEFDAALALPKPNDAVAAMENFVPHLSHRSKIYTFPNPWIASNWGVNGENRPDPNTVDWIIVRPHLLNDVDKGVLMSALVQPGRRLQLGEQAAPRADGAFARLTNRSLWSVVIDDGNLFVARRIRS